MNTNSVSGSISSGSTLTSTGFSSLLFGLSDNNREIRIEHLTEKAKKVLNDVGWLDIPLLMEKLNVNAETAIKIIKKLKDDGIITVQNEI